MTRVRRKAAISVSIVAMLAVSACTSSTSSSSTSGSADRAGAGDTSARDVQVFTWWAAGGEKAGLDALVSLFRKSCAQYSFVNAAVAGGGGDKAKSLLADRLRAGNAPSSFQAQAGGGLSDYIAHGQVQDITREFRANGLDRVLPADLVGQITTRGKIYSLPVNIHRANMVWVNPLVLRKARIDANKSPATVREWITDLQSLRAAGVKTPLVLSRGFAEVMLLETTLLGDLGLKRFNGLFNGATPWSGADVKAALGDVKTLLGYANSDRETIDWDAALSKHLLPSNPARATGGYQVMGDWVPAQILSLKLPRSSYTSWPAPGTDGVYQWLADSFALPRGKGGADPKGARCWLKVVGSAAGQKAFNTVKGSIPARVDAAPAGYTAYQQWAMNQWKSSRLAPSLALGSAGPAAWGNEAQAAMSAFSANPDVATLQKSLTAAATKYANWRSTLG